MTQAGRQGSPRNSSGRNSAGQSKAGRKAGPARNPAQGGSRRAAEPAAPASRAAATAPSSTPSLAKRPSSIRTCRVPPARRQAARHPATGSQGSLRQEQPASPVPASPAPARRPAPPAPSSPSRAPAAAKTAGTRAFGSERFGQNLGPVRKPSRKRGPRGEVPQSELHDADGIRLQKVMASAGVASRRVCEEMIAEGRVEVDGQVVTELGVRVDPKTAVIHVDGLRIQLDENMVYMVFNKPKGVVSTMEDPDGRPCISDFVRNSHGERLFHVGRLDVATEGLLLLTNDGELANRLTHPSYEVPKTYLVQVRGPFPQGIGAAAQGRR